MAARIGNRSGAANATRMTRRSVWRGHSISPIAAALAMGAQGVWTGSLWLTVQEADVPPPQMESYLSATSRDTVRSRSFTGKPCRMLRNDWTEAWEGPDSPGPLGMPLQFMVTAEAVAQRALLSMAVNARRRDG